MLLVSTWYLQLDVQCRLGGLCWIHISTIVVSSVQVFWMRQTLLTGTLTSLDLLWQWNGCFQYRDVVAVLSIRRHCTCQESLPVLFPCHTASLENVQLVSRVHRVVFIVEGGQSIYCRRWFQHCDNQCRVVARRLTWLVISPSSALPLLSLQGLTTRTTSVGPYRTVFEWREIAWGAGS